MWDPISSYSSLPRFRLTRLSSSSYQDEECVVLYLLYLQAIDTILNAIACAGERWLGYFFHYIQEDPGFGLIYLHTSYSSIRDHYKQDLHLFTLLFKHLSDQAPPLHRLPGSSFFEPEDVAWHPGQPFGSDILPTGEAISP